LSKIANDGLTRLYSCTHIATVGVKGLTPAVHNQWDRLKGFDRSFFHPASRVILHKTDDIFSPLLPDKPSALWPSIISYPCTPKTSACPQNDSCNETHFYRAMLRRARYCHSKSSVRPHDPWR